MDVSVKWLLCLVNYEHVRGGNTWQNPGEINVIVRQHSSQNVEHLAALNLEATSHFLDTECCPAFIIQFSLLGTSNQVHCKCISFIPILFVMEEPSASRVFTVEERRVAVLRGIIVCSKKVTKPYTTTDTTFQCEIMTASDEKEGT